MKLIPLTKGYFTKVDDEDFFKFAIYRWHAHITPGRRDHVTARSWSGNLTGCKYLHRLIMNAPEGMNIDHINHDPLDNRKKNLRICTQQENMFNQRMRIDNKSGYVGVHWHPESKKWRARIYTNKKGKSLGLFTSRKEASRAYKKAKKSDHVIKTTSAPGPSPTKLS